MEILSTDTEQLIKDTAKRIFFKEGKLHATTQEIADAAGINRASIHYYFRSRQLLFDKVFAEAIKEMQDKMQVVFEAELSFRERTERFINFFIEKSMEKPYLEMFIITEFNTSHDAEMLMIKPPDKEKRMSELKKGIHGEVAKGTMRPITAEHFLVTLMSFCSYPFLAQDIIKSVLSMDVRDYAKLIRERKEVIMRLLFLDV